MSLARTAIEEGIREGFQKALVDRCDGRYERDRCPLPHGKCACACVEYREKPWWRRIFTQAPEQPTPEECMKAIIWQETGM